MTQIAQDERASIGSQDVIEKRRRNDGKMAKEIELQALKVEMVDSTALKPNPYNPNRQEDKEFELLCQSIKSDGFTMPILANKDYVIIDGEHRWQAAMKVGIKRVPVVLLDLEASRMKLSTIRHNKATGKHDAGLEAMVLADLEKLMGRDFIERELFIDNNALDEILNFVSAPESLSDGHTFNDSWTPVANDSAFQVNDQGKPEMPSKFSARQNVDSAIVLRSATQGANETAYMKVAKKDEEAGRQSLYTLTAIFNTEEAIRVQSILEDSAIAGTTPAERLLTLAQKEKPDVF